MKKTALKIIKADVPRLVRGIQGGYNRRTKTTALDPADKPRDVSLSATFTMLITTLFIFLLPTSLHAFTENPYPFTSTIQEKRFESLTKTIRCVVCQNQSIADSNAPLANDLRNKVYKMVLDGQSDTYIQDYLVKRYGEFILLQPRMNKLTFILWAFPFLALGIVLLALIRLFSRRSH